MKSFLTKKKILEKILSFPNTKKININNNNLQSIRDKLIQAKILVLNFKYLPQKKRILQMLIGIQRLRML